MRTPSRTIAALVSGCVALFLLAPLGEASARPELRGAGKVKAQARVKPRVKRGAPARATVRAAYPQVRRTIDTVGSLGQDGAGYGFNRFSGQRYQSCVFDEGYGRTRPCDAGGDGGGFN